MIQLPSVQSIQKLQLFAQNAWLKISGSYGYMDSQRNYIAETICHYTFFGTHAKSLCEVKLWLLISIYLWHITLLDSEPIVQEQGIRREHSNFRSLLVSPTYCHENLHTLIMIFLNTF